MTSPATAFDTRAWRADLGRRLAAVWYIKATGTPFWIWAFFNGYFYVLRNPLAEPATMPLTPLDALVDFHPGAVVLYVSLWVYVSLAPAVLKNFCELFAYGMATLLLSAIGLAIFYAWPTAVPHFEIDLVAHPSLAVLKGVDLSANACPSLHVAFAVFTAIWLHRVLREHGVTCGRDIDLDAIASAMGARVTYDNLDGSTARVIRIGPPWVTCSGASCSPTCCR